MPDDVVLTVVLVAACGQELGRWHLAAPRPDLAVVEALAHWHLAARQAGCSLRLLDAGADVADLLAFVGLAALLTGGPRR